MAAENKSSERDIPAMELVDVASPVRIAGHLLLLRDAARSCGHRPERVSENKVHSFHLDHKQMDYLRTNM